jgi:hypothetical protein
LIAWLIVVALVLSVLMKDDGTAERAQRRRARIMYQAAKRQAEYDRLPPATRTARVRVAPPKMEVPAKSEAPAFLADVESTLLNLQYKKKEAAQAVQRATGDDFSTRLKNALELLRIPDAKLTA